MAAIKGGAAVIKGFFTNTCSAIDWPQDPEDACIKHAEFLKVWIPYSFSEPDAREAWKEALPRMSRTNRNAIVNSIAEAREWLGKTWKNLKTGEKHPILKRHTPQTQKVLYCSVTKPKACRSQREAAPYRRHTRKAAETADQEDTLQSFLASEPAMAIYLHSTVANNPDAQPNSRSQNLALSLQGPGWQSQEWQHMWHCKPGWSSQPWREGWVFLH